MFTVTIEADRRLVRSYMSGMLSPQEAEAYEREEQVVVRAAGWANGGFDHLVEFDGDVVQTQAVIEAFGRLFTDASLKARRVALVRSGALARIQMRRMTQRRADCEVFATLAEAEAWLARP